MLKQIKSTTKFIQKQIDFVPKIGIILGTGLNKMTRMLENPIVLKYEDIPNFQTSTAPSHEGKLVFGTIASTDIVIMQGRLHYYEGYSMKEITFPIRVFKELGIGTLIITNSAGSLNQDLQPGDVALIKDHINFMHDNPLIGKNYPDLGNRFPSLHQQFSPELQALARQIAKKEKFELKDAVYTAVTGPTLETKAESLMLAKLGADIVGMSTVPEIITAVHSGLNLIAISAITNLSNIFHSKEHSQIEIRENAAKAAQKIQKIILGIIKNY